MKSSYTLYLLLLLFLPLKAVAQAFPAQDVEKPRKSINVARFSGTGDEKIIQAIKAAASTSHKTVYLPNGTYKLRKTILLKQGANTEIHLVGESRDGVLLIPDLAYLKSNYKGGKGGRLMTIINLDSGSPFASIDVSIQNMTIDMMAQQVMGQAVTYTVGGHGIRVGQGWRKGQFKVNNVILKNIGGYGIGIQDRGGHPKNNITLSNLHFDTIGSDAIDTKEASGEGNKNLTIKNISVNEIGFTDGGAAVGIDVRYRNTIIDKVRLISQPRRKTPSGEISGNTGILFRADAACGNAKLSNIYIKGFLCGIQTSSINKHKHEPIHIKDFKIHDYSNTGIRLLGTGHSISDGYVYSKKGKKAIHSGSGVNIRNVTKGPWPKETPTAPKSPKK